ncbi:Periplasmic serine endoprotease DegP precursor [Pseudobythopirellula maris]|uniref:Periplasmic serine endoprotease DegP n=1 Tax=Pseudobythopirellula maris TaxID=2527991 RepID=A0A5C5ZR51_9BACT|nr:S1C family serine protease [Pseudobythopirellula maris]TWT89969.1 Periplasmic serine endoprotease DegP precursor [Pseudobythopirellula maris]
MRTISLALLLLLLGFSPAAADSSAGRIAPNPYRAAIDHAQRRVVKLFGSGGLRGMEAYQTGVVIGGEGLVLTVNSPVLESGGATAVDSFGRRFTCRVVATDPILEIALLEVDAFTAPAEPLANYKLDPSAPLPEPGRRVLAVSNAFGIATGAEAASVQRGVAAAVARLNASRSSHLARHTGEVIVLDAVTSNPGAAGGAVVGLDGELLGLIGKEAQSNVTGAWFNYAIPTATLATATERLLQGASQASDPQTAIGPALPDLGLTLIPEITPRAPAYVDHVEPDSAAHRSGLQADDLLLMVGDHTVATVDEARRRIAATSDEEIELTIQRGSELVVLRLGVPATAPEATP